MNKTIIQLVGAGAAGLGVGVLTGYLIAKGRFEGLADKEVEAAKEHYKRLNKVEEYATPESAAAALKVEVDLEGVEVAIGERMANGKIAYNKIVKDQEYAIPDEAVDPMAAQRAKVTQQESMETSVQVNVFEVVNEDKNTNLPYIISEAEYMEEEDYAKASLIYFQGDDTLMDEAEIPVEDRTIVGDTLKEFDTPGERNDPDVIHVRNVLLRTDIEIVRDERTWVEVVASSGV